MGRLSTLEQRQAEMRERQSHQEPSLVPLLPHGERHFSVTDVAKLWSLSRDSVRRIFRREPGVMAIGERYVTLRIPESVLERVHRKLSNADNGYRTRLWPSSKKRRWRAGNREGEGIACNRELQ